LVRFLQFPFTGHMKNLLLVFVFSSLSAVCLAQDLYVAKDTSANAYYATDSIIRSGVRIIDQGQKENSFSCKVNENGITKVFTPYQVKEYGFNRKTVYVSKKISINNTELQVFLLRLVHGKMNLYLYGGGNRKIFYLEPEGGTTQILPDSDIDGMTFRDQLRKVTADCQEVERLINDVRYKNASLSEFIKSYNECGEESLKRTEYGLSAGAGIINLLTPAINNYPQITASGVKNCFTWNFGLFIDHPIGYSNFSLYPQLIFSFIEHLFSSYYLGSLYRNSISIASLNIPLSLRYYINAGRITPFVSAGGIIVFNAGNNQSYTAYKHDSGNPDRWVQNGSGEMGMKQFSTGISLGAGARIPVDSGRTVRLELRYSRYFQRWQIISFGGEEISVNLSFNIRKYR
jgi:hypothetical protein